MGTCWAPAGTPALAACSATRSWLAAVEEGRAAAAAGAGAGRALRLPRAVPRSGRSLSGSGLWDRQSRGSASPAQGTHGHFSQDLRSLPCWVSRSAGASGCGGPGTGTGVSSHVRSGWCLGEPALAEAGGLTAEPGSAQAALAMERSGGNQEPAGTRQPGHQPTQSLTSLAAELAPAAVTGGWQVCSWRAVCGPVPVFPGSSYGARTWCRMPRPFLLDGAWSTPGSLLLSQGLFLF